MEEIILLGYGGHARSVADSIENTGKYCIIGYTDSKPTAEKCRYPYLGDDSVLEELFVKGINNAFITVGYMGRNIIRDMLYTKLVNGGYHVPTIIDASAVIAGDVKIGEGTYVGKNCVVNSGADLGKMCIINTGAVIEHSDVIGEFTHIAVGATLCGDVHVGKHCFVGANATLIQGISVGDGTIVGAGAVVVKDIEANCTAVGVPAEKIMTNNR